jgi:predicted MFS family arabinose efflux permease
VSRHGFRRFLALVAANGLFGNVVGLFLPIYFQRIGLTGLETGTYIALTSAAAILLALPVGISTDQRSIAGILVLGLVLTAANRLGFLFTTGFGWFCLFALLGSFGARFFGTGVQALFFKLTGEDNRRDAGRYMLANFVSGGVGLILGGWLVERFDFRTAFLFGVIANAGLMVLASRLPKNDTVTLKLEEYRRAVWQPNVLVLTAIFFLSSLHWGAEHTSYTPFLHHVLGLSIFSASLYAGVGFCVVGAGTYLGAILVERKVVKDLPSLLGIGFLLAGLFHILMCVKLVWLSFVFRTLHEIGDGFVFLVYYQGIAKVFKVDKIGGCAAFVSLFTAIGTFVGALLSGWIGGKYGPEWPLILSGIVLCLIPGLLRIRDAGLEGEYERV